MQQINSISRQLLSLGAILFLITSCSSKEEKSSNILVIVADDLGFSDLGCYGGEIETPNLDNLTSAEMLFTEFNNTGRCWPSRAALLTGYYPQQIGRDNVPGISGGGGLNKVRPEWANVLPHYLKAKGELRKTHGHVTDIIPTILDLAAISPTDEQQVSFRGESIQPILEEDTDWEHPVWYYHEGNLGIRVGNSKLVSAKDEPWELFNLENDRTESKNHASENPNKVQELEKQWTIMLNEIRKNSPNKIPEKELVWVKMDNS